MKNMLIGLLALHVLSQGTPPVPPSQETCDHAASEYPAPPFAGCDGVMDLQCIGLCQAAYSQTMANSENEYCRQFEAAKDEYRDQMATCNSMWVHGSQPWIDCTTSAQVHFTMQTAQAMVDARARDLQAQQDFANCTQACCHPLGIVAPLQGGIPVGPPTSQCHHTAGEYPPPTGPGCNGTLDLTCLVGCEDAYATHMAAVDNDRCQQDEIAKENFRLAVNACDAQYADCMAHHGSICQHRREECKARAAQELSDAFAANARNNAAAVAGVFAEFLECATLCCHPD